VIQARNRERNLVIKIWRLIGILGLIRGMKREKKISVVQYNTCTRPFLRREDRGVRGYQNRGRYYHQSAIKANDEGEGDDARPTIMVEKKRSDIKGTKKQRVGTKDYDRRQAKVATARKRWKGRIAKGYKEMRSQG
jgi:hypothetical protein